MQKILNIILVAVLCIGLTACGQMGPLYLPTSDKTGAEVEQPVNTQEAHP
jgi:predicted small lipoprotein YifL